MALVAAGNQEVHEDGMQSDCPGMEKERGGGGGGGGYASTSPDVCRPLQRQEASLHRQPPKAY